MWPRKYIQTEKNDKFEFMITKIKSQFEIFKNRLLSRFVIYKTHPSFSSDVNRSKTISTTRMMITYYRFC